MIEIPLTIGYPHIGQIMIQQHMLQQTQQPLMIISMSVMSETKNIIGLLIIALNL